MPPEEDVTMTEEVPEAAEKPESESQSQLRRTDHDWQPYYPPLAPLALSRPHPSQNLISLYSLDKIAATVRRTDPTTGEKTNKLRKSYEGKVKQLHIAGVNKAVCAPGEFIGGGLLDIPEEPWHSEHVSGKQIQSAPDWLAKLDRALQIAPGRLPVKDSEQWKKLIGTDEAPKAKTVPEAIKKVGAFSQPLSGGTTPSMQDQALRPARTGAKRRYVESTFKGYGEGFADDGLDTPNMSEEESRDLNQPKKRRRKVNTCSRKTVP
jgi:hypothetical protein